MALILPSQSSGVPLSPAKLLNDAIDDFKRILTEDQRTTLQNIQAIPDADAVLVFTAQLDSSQHRRGRSIATRLHPVLQSVREFSAVIDTFVSSNPEVAALIWGSVKLTRISLSTFCRVPGPVSKRRPASNSLVQVPRCSHPMLPACSGGRPTTLFVPHVHTRACHR
jgi:hypothetical protein